MIDQHMHTVFSPDASPTATIEAMIEHAASMGFQAIALTDHVDLDSPQPLFHRLPDAYALNRLIEQARLTTSLDVRYGVELGYQPHVVEGMKAWLQQQPFDVVLLSVHYVNRLDPYAGTYFHGRTAFEAYDEYFKTLIEAVDRFPNFDILTHLDYIARYAPYEHTGFVFEDHKARLKELFDRLIQHDKILELNTSPWRRGMLHAHPHIDILRWYFDCGGRRISLGSDAHKPEDIGHEFERAIKLLKSIGFTHYTDVKNRQFYDVLL
jgi:histidinol-phosphatase (PHP family)